MRLLEGPKGKPYFKYDEVHFFAMHLFLLCLDKNKVLTLYSYVKLIVESDSALVCA